MEEPKLRDSKKAGMLTFSNLNYSSLSSKLQEKSAYSRRAVAQMSYLQVGTSRWSEREQKKGWTNSAIVVRIEVGRCRRVSYSFYARS